MSNKIDMDSVIRMLFPPGPIWEPEEHIEESLGVVELIQNGTFLSNINYWTEVSGGGTLTWSSGTMVLATNSGV